MRPAALQLGWRNEGPIPNSPWHAALPVALADTKKIPVGFGGHKAKTHTAGWNEGLGHTPLRL